MPAGLRAVADLDTESRLVLARRVVDDLARTEPVVAALVVGSTALRRCSPRADLDVVVITPSSPDGDRFTSLPLDGVRVEVERLSQREALDATVGTGWVWELRAAARIGCGVPVVDPDGFAAQLARRAAAMTPDPERVEATLRRVYLLLVELAAPGGEPARRLDAVRGCFDNLALLALLERPRRYQKAKWVLADLLHAGEDALVDALLAAYGVAADDAAPAHDAVTGARALLGAVYEMSGVPSHEEILARGHAPELAEASYVSRCLDDAEDLAASGRFVEAQYVAKFSARLGAALLGDDGAIVDVLAGRGLADRYLALFPEGPGPATELIEAALAAADARRRPSAVTA
ncbi:MAG: hypothetical protein ACRD12_15175 [Acidimicrobiales bacterium]